MRVIAGTYRSRSLKCVPGFSIRPTPDRLREALFNILAPRLSGATFIDAYAGTGAVGIEALSRGARQVTFFERELVALACLRHNLASLHIGSEAVVLKGSAARLLKDRGADIVFLDPPYGHRNEYSDALAALGAERSRLVIAQHEAGFDPGNHAGAWRRTRIVKHGSHGLSFYEPVAPGPIEPSAE